MSNERINEIAAPVFKSYTELRKPIKDGFSGTVKNHISISMTVTSFVVAIICQIGFHYIKPWLPCMKATKIGMTTEAELKRMNKRRMAHHRLIIYETPDGRVKMVSYKKSKSYVTLKLKEKDEGTELMNNETAGQLAIKTQESVYPYLDEVDI